MSAATEGSGSAPESGAESGWDNVTLVRVTAQALNSGWRDTGSTASLVTALIDRYSPNTSFQWKGAKQLPTRTRSVMTAGSTARPRREAISIGSSSEI